MLKRKNANIGQLNLTYLALSGNHVGCPEFMGVTTTPTLTHEGRTAERRMMLVFERVTEGSLLDYLVKKLPLLPFMEAWHLVVRMISSVANGLDTLHRHNVVHRQVSPQLSMHNQVID